MALFYNQQNKGTQICELQKDKIVFLKEYSLNKNHIYANIIVNKYIYNIYKIYIMVKPVYCDTSNQKLFI